MFEYFYPDLFYKSVHEIDFEALRKRRIRGLVFDIDNTLSPYFVQSPPEEVVKLLRRLTASGFQVCLLSNNKIDRINSYNSGLKLPAVSKARKPFLRGIKKALRLMGTNSTETAIIGDQIFTDILCGKRMHILTILIKPISERDEFTVRLKRAPEKYVLEEYFERVKQGKV